MSAAPGSEGGIPGLAASVVLGCDPGPVVDRRSQSMRAGLSHFHPTGFSAPLGDRGDPGQSVDGVIISRLDGLMGLREQRGEDDPSHSRQRAQDRRVALLDRLPRFGLRSCGQLVDKSIEATGDLFQLAVDQPDALGDRSDVSLRGLRRSSRDRQRGATEDATDLTRIYPTDPIGAEYAGELLVSQSVSQSGRVSRRWGQRPDIQEPVGSRIFPKIKSLRIVAPELLTNAIGQTVALFLELFGHARPLAQLDNCRIKRLQAPEAMTVGAQRGGQHQSVTPIVLGACGREPVAEAIELLGVDRINPDPAIHQRFDYRPMRHFNRHRDSPRVRRLCDQPIDHLAQTFGRAGEGALNRIIWSDQANLMLCARPVHADESCRLLLHVHLHPNDIEPPRYFVFPCTGAQSQKARLRRDFPLDVQHGPTDRGARPPMCKKAQGANGCSRPAGSRRSC